MITKRILSNELETQIEVALKKNKIKPSGFNIMVVALVFRRALNSNKNIRVQDVVEAIGRGM